VYISKLNISIESTNARGFKVGEKTKGKNNEITKQI